jgi:hypothetical protein
MSKKIDALERELRAEQDRRNAIARCKVDLPFFCQFALRIRPKMGALTPMTLNPAQLKLHQIVEEQKARTGRVRVIVLKARQLGVSTFVAARFFHKTLFGEGLRTYIASHEKRASSNLFQIVRRFYDHLPPEIKPATSASSAEELIFQKSDSGYLVGTASYEGTGRSATSQLLHCSETAFWLELEQNFASLIQTTPDLDETEIVVESTACGFNEFYTLWRKAEAGDSEFLPVFLPWSLDPQYRRRPDEGEEIELTSEERALASLHKLDDEQILWRRAKISQLGSEIYFRQEYPLTAAEAFISPSMDAFIPADLVLSARQEDVPTDSNAPLILGVDPAGSGADKTAIAYRRGRRIEKVTVHRGLTTMEIAGMIARLIQDEDVGRVFIDVTGMGVGVYDRLAEQGYDNICVPVNFASRAIEPEAFGEDGRVAGGCANRRAELWKNLKRALEAGRFALPDDNALQADLVSVGFKHDSSGRLLLESKADMKRRSVPSPDLGDAVALTFAGSSYSAPASRGSYPSRPMHRGARGSTSWMGS